jgi:molecular chaperone GrpE
MKKKHIKKVPSRQERAETSSQDIKLTQKIKELEDGWKRTQADFDNYRKRTEEQRLDIIELSKADFMTKITPVLDNFRRAFSHIPHNKPATTYEVVFNRYISGVKQIEKQLEDILKDEGLEKIDASSGTKFDHNLHEAISFEINDKIPADTIIDELESGWTYRGRVIKPAKVRVSKGK